MDGWEDSVVSMILPSREYVTNLPMSISERTSWKKPFDHFKAFCLSGNANKKATEKTAEQRFTILSQETDETTPNSETEEE
ncbi:hypothetical protein JTB14_023388 [Gonioctena quinquepunctata]|nr:hypothetical protein JTB14_023388 [Gonioctena quinquepunctata]